MLVTIVYSEQFESNAKSLRTAVEEEWDGVKVNLLGTRRTLYQIQLEKDLVYSKDTVEKEHLVLISKHRNLMLLEYQVRDEEPLN